MDATRRVTCFTFKEKLEGPDLGWLVQLERAFTKIVQIMARPGAHLSYIDLYREKLQKSSCVKLEGLSLLSFI